MKKTLGKLVVLFAMSLVVGAALAQSPYQVNVSWKNTDGTTPVCATSVTKACIKSRIVVDATVTPAVVLSSAIDPTATSFLTPTLSYTGPVTRLYNVQTSYLDATGAAVTTAAGLCGTANTPPPCAVPVFIVTPPANVTATPVIVSGSM